MYTLHSDWNYREQNIESLSRFKLEAIALTNYLLTFLSREEHQKEHGAKSNEGKPDGEEDEKEEADKDEEGEENEIAKEMDVNMETQVGSSQGSLQDAQGSQTQI